MNNEYTESLVELLTTVKGNIMTNTHVATLGVVKTTGDIIKVNPFPLIKSESEYSINCYSVDDLTLSAGDVVLVLFCDRDFISNLKRLKSGGKITNLDSDKPELHSEKYGVVIGKITI